MSIQTDVSVLESVPRCGGSGATVSWCELNWTVLGESSFHFLFACVSWAGNFHTLKRKQKDELVSANSSEALAVFTVCKDVSVAVPATGDLMVAVGFCVDLKKHRVWFLTRSEHLSFVETGLHFESHLYSRIAPRLQPVPSPQASISCKSDGFYFQSRVHANHSVYYLFTGGTDRRQSNGFSRQVSNCNCLFHVATSHLQICISPQQHSQIGAPPPPT